MRLGPGGRAERIGLEAVAEREPGRLEHVLGLDQIAAGQRSDRLRARDNGDIGPMAADAGADHEPPDGAVERIGDANRREARLPGCDRLGQLGLRRSPLLPEAVRRGFFSRVRARSSQIQLLQDEAPPAVVIVLRAF